jgi:lipocalin
MRALFVLSVLMTLAVCVLAKKKAKACEGRGPKLDIDLTKFDGTWYRSARIIANAGAVRCTQSKITVVNSTLLQETLRSVSV